MFGGTNLNELQRADLLFAQATVLSENCNYVGAAALFRECAAIRRTALGAHVETARALYSQAMYSSPDNLAGLQLELLRESLSILQHQPGGQTLENVAETAVVLQEMGGIMRQQGDQFQHAVTTHSEALYIRARRMLGIASGDDYFNQLVVRRWLRRRHLSAALDTIAAHFGEDSEAVADACMARAKIDRFTSPEPDRRAQVRDMIHFLERALQIKQRLFGDYDKQVAFLHELIAEAIAELNIPSLASQRYEEALRIRLAIHGAASIEVFKTLKSIQSLWGVRSQHYLDVTNRLMEHCPVRRECKEVARWWIDQIRTSSCVHIGHERLDGLFSAEIARHLTERLSSALMKQLVSEMHRLPFFFRIYENGGDSLRDVFDSHAGDDEGGEVRFIIGIEMGRVTVEDVRAKKALNARSATAVIYQSADYQELE